MNRRTWWRPYSYEIVTLVNLAVIAWLTGSIIITSLPATLASFIPTLGGYALIGVVVRALIAWRRRELPAYLRIVRSAGWLSDTVRLVLFGSLMVHTYFWIKLVVPLLHPRLYDQELWSLDQKMFLGLSPNILFLNVFSKGVVLQLIDWSYARIFFVSMSVAFIYFLSSPSRRLRAAFSTGTTLLWLARAGR